MNPTLAHFQLLRRLRQQLRHSAGLGVVYLFSDYALASQWLLTELDAHLRSKSQRLQVLKPVEPTDAPSLVLQPLLAPPDAVTGLSYWLAMAEPDQQWDAYRDTVLARLNENRSVLSRHRAFIFLLLPTRYESRAADVAPDLWSVRSASHVLAPWVGDGVVGRGHARLAAPSAQVASQGGRNMTLPLSLHLVLQRWQKQWTKWNRNRRLQLAPTLAWNLVDQLRENHRFDRAKVVAAQALTISRHLKTLTGDSPQSLRDLSVSLNKVGDVARDLGQLEDARSAYTESLAIRRQFKALTGDSPQSLRDLSVSLVKVGEVARDLGQLEDARNAYTESLAICRQLKNLTGDSPQSLRDLSVSLNKVGEVVRDLGQLEEARSAYAESLAICRQLRSLTGDSPQSLRDLSVSLDNVGEVARDLGQLEAARSAYTESLAISRQLKTLTGDSPQSLRDLSVSLNKVGDVVRGLGQLEEARKVFAEALSLIKQLREVLSADATLAPMEQHLWAKLRKIDQAPAA